MRSSAAVSLLLASSMSIFGIYGRQRKNPAVAPGPEPVWVDGQMGVYNPDTGEFVPSDSPLFDETCDLIQARRDAITGTSDMTQPTAAPSVPGAWYYSPGGYHHVGYYGHSYYQSFDGSGSSSSDWEGGSSASRSYDSYSGGADAARSGSVRGGIGDAGHGFGGGHA